MGKIFILEGLDGSGKTTACRQLETSGIIHLNLWQDKTLVRTSVNGYRGIIELLKNLDMTKSYSIDRFLMSDIIYDRVLRGQRVGEYKTLLYNFMRVLPIVYIVLMPEQKFSDAYLDSKITLSAEERRAISAGYRSLTAELVLNTLRPSNVYPLYDRTLLTNIVSAEL